MTVFLVVGNSNYSKPATNINNQVSNGNNATSSQDKGKGKLYMMTAREEEARRDVVTGTFSINSTPVKVLFDSGASLSFIAHATVRNLAEANLKKAEGKRQVIEANLALRRARTRVEASNTISS